MNHNWYAVITAKVLLAKDISSTQKLLIALVSNLSNERGYCFASNTYLGDCLDIGPITISLNIADLEKKGYLGRVILRTESNRVENRILTVIEKDADLLKNSLTPLKENFNTPLKENFKENNKVFNNKYNKERDVIFLDSFKNKKKEKAGLPGAEKIKPPFCSTVFNNIWAEWLKYRDERELSKYTSLGLSKTFTKLIRDSDAKEEIAIQMIEESMANNWQNIFPIKD